MGGVHQLPVEQIQYKKVKCLKEYDSIGENRYHSDKQKHDHLVIGSAIKNMLKSDVHNNIEVVLLLSFILFNLIAR